MRPGFLGKSILNGTDFAIIATDVAGTIQFFNIGAERMLGYAAGEVVNKKALDLFLDPQRLVDHTKALNGEFATTIIPGFDTLAFKAARGIGGLLDLDYIRMDDSRFPARASITALRDGKGEIIGYLTVASDASAEQLTKAAGREKIADELFMLAVEACPSGMLMVDRDGKMALANAEIERQFGYASRRAYRPTRRHAGPRPFPPSASRAPPGVQSSAGDTQGRIPRRFIGIAQGRH